MRADTQPIKVCDMRTLELEKARLRRVCRAMERRMDARLHYAKKNYVLLVLSGLFPGVRREKNLFKWVVEIIQGAWDTGRLQSILLTVIVALAEFFSVRFGAKFLANFFAGFGKGKDEKKDKEEQDASFRHAG